MHHTQGLFFFTNCLPSQIFWWKPVWFWLSLFTNFVQYQIGLTMLHRKYFWSCQILLGAISVLENIQKASSLHWNLYCIPYIGSGSCLTIWIYCTYIGCYNSFPGFSGAYSATVIYTRSPKPETNITWSLSRFLVEHQLQLDVKLNLSNDSILW